LKDKGLKSFALGLLKKNYRKSDDGIIMSAMGKTTSFPHHAYADISSIYSQHRSEQAFPILFRLYQDPRCASHRNGIVRAMDHCGVLTDVILDECQYDSNDEIRRFARQLLRKKLKAES
jgi:hypothetical protein